MQVHAAGTHTVGKVVGDNFYVYRACLEDSTIPQDVVEERSENLPLDFDYQIIKSNRRTNDVSFIQSPDWNESPEPLVGDSYKVDADGTVKFRASNPENPQIYHHKYQFVSPDYHGFNVAEARTHAQQWESLHPDKTRIGYKKYWDREVVPKLSAEPIFGEAETDIANRTARAHGAVGGKAVVPRYVEETSRKSETILDFGAGPEAVHTRHLKRHGFKHVEAFEFGHNVRPGVHNPKALLMEFDTVFASNVLNVQSNLDMLGKTVDELAHVVAPEGRLVANLPAEPRKMAIDSKTLTALLSKRFCEVERVGGTPSAPVLEARYPRQHYHVKAHN